MIRTINVSKDEDYHSQVNNLEVPLSACNTTSMIMALKDLGIGFYRIEGFQEEDLLSALLLSNTAREEMRKLERYAYDREIPPNQVHSMLSLYTNRLVGRKVTRFVEKGDWSMLLDEIYSKRPVVVGTTLTDVGHIVEVVGLVDEDAIVTKIIIDDPYGDPRTGYKSNRGNNVELDAEYFRKVWLGHMHIFRPGAA